MSCQRSTTALYCLAACRQIAAIDNARGIVRSAAMIYSSLIKHYANRAVRRKARDNLKNQRKRCSPPPRLPGIGFIPNDTHDSSRWPGRRRHL
jgi:hypothetical protein